MTQPGAQADAVEDVVAQHQRGRIAGQEVPRQQEGLRQALGLGLHDVGELQPQLRTVAQQPLEAGLVLVVVMMRISRSPAASSVLIG